MSTSRTISSLALTAGAVAIAIAAPTADAAPKVQRGAAPAAAAPCPTGYTRQTVTADRFTLAGCIAKTTNLGGLTFTYHAVGTVTLDGVTLVPEPAGAELDLVTGTSSGKLTSPASVRSSSIYDIQLEGQKIGSFQPNIVASTGLAAAGAAHAFAAGAAAATTAPPYDCSFDPNDAASFFGAQILASVTEFKCTLTATGLELSGKVKLPAELTQGLNIGANIDLKVDKNTGLTQSASLSLLDTPLQLGPLVTEGLSLTYDRTTDRWSGGADIHEAANGALFHGQLGHFNASVVIQAHPFKVIQLKTDIKTPSLMLVDQGIGPMLVLNRIGFNYQFNGGTSFTLAGTLGAEGALALPGIPLPTSVLSVDGTFQVQTPATAGQPYVFKIDGDVDFSQGWGALSASLASGTASITYSTNGRLAFHGSATGGFDNVTGLGNLAGVTMTLDGSLSSAGLSVTGNGSAFVTVPGIGTFTQQGASAAMTGRGFGFCVLGNVASYAHTWAGTDHLGLGCDLSSIQ